MNRIVTGSYKQKTVKFLNASTGLSSDNVLTVFADDSGVVFAGLDNGLNVIEKDGISFFECEPVKHITRYKEKIWFTSGKSVYVYENGTVYFRQSFDDGLTGIASGNRLFCTTETLTYVSDGGEFSLYLDSNTPVTGIAAKDDRLIGFSERCLLVFAGKREHWRCISPEHTLMPRVNVNCGVFDNETGFIWLGTDRGIVIYDSHNNWFTSEQIKILPEEDIFDITIKDGVVAAASNAGIITIRNGLVKYLPAERYAPSPEVGSVCICGEKLYAATERGLSVITEEDYTLEKKAEYFFGLAEKYYVRADGYVTFLSCPAGSDLSKASPIISDNDGLWGHMYLTALCYCYAVTKDEKILAAARRTMQAELKLTAISGIKGFTARAIRHSGEKGFGENLESRVPGCEWHKSSDANTEWLGETSSDEMTGHFLGFSHYYDFCADEAEKKQISEAIGNIADHIIEHNFRLCDKDGLPTTWACWDPDQLNRNDMWQWEKGVNSLEILSFLKVAFHVTGDEKYNRVFEHLALDEHYLLNAAFHKKDDGRSEHIDDNLGFLCSLSILRLEKNEEIRKYIFMGMRQHWEYERDEGFAMWNFIYGAFSGDECDLEAAVKHLKDMPLDPFDYKMFNSARRNLAYTDCAEKWKTGMRLLQKALPIDERSNRTFSDNPYFADGGNGDFAVGPYNYLLPYWFARYYGLIE